MARILVGFDGSDAAFGAARFALRIATRLGDPVTLAYVAPPQPIGTVGPEWSPREQLDYAEEWLRRIAQELGPNVTTQILGGHPALALEELARDRDIELVVVGSHGLNPVERALLGSTASRLIRTCNKPVMVIPAPAWRSSIAPAA